jgi:hypothetical protein
MAPKIKRTKHSSANDHLGAGADGQFKKTCLTCDFTISGEISRVRAMSVIGRALADHFEDLALACRERIDDAAGLRIAVIQPRKQASHETGNLV